MTFQGPFEPCALQMFNWTILTQRLREENSALIRLLNVKLRAMQN